MNEDNFIDTYKLIKLKGELLCLLIDLKIRTVSKNEKSLDDVVKFMVQWFGLQHFNSSDMDLVKIISSVTSIDFTTFFDLYIDGNIELPFKETLGQAGIFVNTRVDTIPDLGKIELKKNNVIAYFSENSPLFHAGVKKGDKLLSINNNRLIASYQLEELLDSLVVNGDNELMIERSGLALLLNIKVPGRIVRQFSIINSIPETEFQLEVRKKWLNN